MQLTLLLIAAFAAFTSAVNIHGYTKYYCPSGYRWSCFNIASGVCCKFPVNIRSIRWGLPAKAAGIEYTGLTCNGPYYTPITRGPTNICANFLLAGYPVRSAKWRAGYFPRRVARADSQLEAREENCVDASVFTYTHNGETTTLNVPEGFVGQVADLSEKEDFDGLKELSKDWQSAFGDLDLDLPPVENVDHTTVEG